MFIADLSGDPYFNLAAEEYLLKEAGKPIFRLWRNTPCVVVGRHQIIDIEVNREAAKWLGIPILRRLSGGGAVYHDLGNVNYTLISRTDNIRGMDFDVLKAPIVAALNLLGIPAAHAGRGDITVGGAKVSGSAFYMWRGFTLHHGTLLFDADLGVLESLLEVKEDGVERPRSIRSVRSRVTNIKEACPGLFADVSAFQNAFGRALGALLGEDPDEMRPFSDEDKLRIEGIADALYRKSEWNESGQM